MFLIYVAKLCSVDLAVMSFLVRIIGIMMSLGT